MIEDFIVSDSGPIITLEKLEDGFEFIGKLYKKIIIPKSVYNEVSFGGDISEYIGNLIEVKTVENEFLFHDMNRLHVGEKEAIAISLQLKSKLLIEEEIGRNIAFSLGIKISGIAGQIVKANRLKIINKKESIDKIEKLFYSNRINKRLYSQIVSKIISQS